MTDHTGLDDIPARSSIDDINVRRMVQHISDQLSHTIGMETADAKPIIKKFFDDLIDRRGINDFTVGGPGEGIVESFTVNDEKRGNRRGVLVGGNTADGERITHLFLRNKRTAKKRGRGLIGMLVMPYSFQPSRPLKYIQFTVEVKRG
jgi:hypothetical protein